MGLLELVRCCFDFEYQRCATIDHHLLCASHLIFSPERRFRGYMHLQDANTLLAKLIYPAFDLEARAEELSRLYALVFARELRTLGYPPWYVEQEVANYFLTNFIK